MNIEMAPNLFLKDTNFKFFDNYKPGLIAAVSPNVKPPFLNPTVYMLTTRAEISFMMARLVEIKVEIHANLIDSNQSRTSSEWYLI